MTNENFKVFIMFDIKISHGNLNKNILKSCGKKSFSSVQVSKLLVEVAKRTGSGHFG